MPGIGPDGDGTVAISITRYGFAIELAFVDNYKPLLEHIASFLKQRGFFSTFLFQRTNGKTFWRLRVRRNEDTVGILRFMLPHLDKKLEEAKVAIDYLTNRVDGVEFAKRINYQVRELARGLGRDSFPRTCASSNLKERSLDSIGQHLLEGTKR